MSDNDSTEQISDGSYGKINIIDENTIMKTTEKFNKNGMYYRQNIQEIVFLSCVEHNNIVKTKKIRLTDNEIQIEQEKGEQTLHDYINNNNKKTRMIHFKFIFFQLVKVLFFIHKNNFIHGDIKPNNILLSSNMTIKLIDFGGICSFRINDNHKPICTPSFCPPEGWAQLNIKCLNSKFDVWSLAMTMYFYSCRKYLLDFKDDKTIYYINEFKWSFNKYYHHNIDYIKNIIDDQAFKLLEKMLMYDPDDRISTDELYYDQYFSEFTKEQIDKIKFISEFDSSYMSNYMINDWKQRKNLINWVYEYLESNNMLDHLVLTIWNIDRYINLKKIKITSQNKNLFGAASIIISSILLANKYMHHDDILKIIPKYISKIKLINIIDDMMTTLNFKIYAPTFDYIIKNNRELVNYTKIYNMLSDKKYIGLDQHFLAEIYLN